MQDVVCRRLTFLLLLLLQFLIAFSIVKIFNIGVNYSAEVVFFSVDVSFLIVIIIMLKMWKIDIQKLFKKISLKHISFLTIIGILITLLYPVFNIPNLLNSFATNKTGVMMPSMAFFENENYFVSKLYYVPRALVVMPLLEEILYRGIIQNKLKDKFSTAWAIVFSSLFFAVGHMAFEQSITVFFSSLILGYVYHKSKNLTTVVLLHSFINLGFLFSKIEYNDSISISILFYHLILIGLLIFITKTYPKKYSHGN